MAKRRITITQFADELEDRLNKNKTVDCCKDELLNFASMARNKMGTEMIEVNWQD